MTSFTSFDPVGFAIFARIQQWLPPAGGIFRWVVFYGCVHVRPARSIFSSALNFCALQSRPWSVHHPARSRLRMRRRTHVYA